MNNFRAKTRNQKTYVRSMIENGITICAGPSGTGKDICPLAIALQHIHSPNSPINKLYITRPMVATSSREFPYLKGDLNDKCLPYMMPMVDNLVQLLGSRKDVNHLIEEGTIVMEPLELMRGRTFTDCFVVFSEMQNSTIDQAIMAITRIGENCKMIFNGDPSQTDIGGPNGLDFLVERLADTDLIGYCEMDKSDIQRHKIIAKILQYLKKEV